MKHVGGCQYSSSSIFKWRPQLPFLTFLGPYAALFGKLFSEVYMSALHDINEKDCPKLDFLLNTWDERKLLPKDLIFNMKSHLGNRSIPVNEL